MHCPKCGHRDQDAAIRCSACGTSFPRTALEEFERIQNALDEATAWARDGLIGRGDLERIFRHYRRRIAQLEQQLGLTEAAVVELRPPVAQATAPFPPVAAAAVEQTGRRPPPPVTEPVRPPRPRPAAAADVRRQPAPPPITWDRLWKSLGSEQALDVMLYLGAFLVVVSFGVLVATHWARYPAVVQALISLSVTGLFYAGGALTRSRLRARHSGTVIVGIGALLVPFNVVTIAQIFGVAHLGWPALWLASSLAMLPLNIATAGWLRAEFFGYVALASALTATVSAAALAGLAAPWWGVPAVLLGTASVLGTPRLGRLLPAPLHRPLNTGGVLLGLLPVPWLMWLGEGLPRYLGGAVALDAAPPVAAAWWSAAALGVILLARARRRDYAYGAAAAVCGAAVLTAAALAPVRWVGLALVGLAAAEALSDRALARTQDAVATPMRHAAWGCTAAGGLWSLFALATAAPALGAVAAVVLRWSSVYRRLWLTLLGLALIAASFTAFLLLRGVAPAWLGVWWLGLGLAYLGAACLVRLPAGAGRAAYLASYGLIVCAQVPALLWPSAGAAGLQVLTVGAAVAVSSWSIRRGDHDPELQTLLRVLPVPWRETLFAWVAALLFPLWSLLVWRRLGAADAGAGVMLSAIALLYANGAYRLGRSGSPRGVPLLAAAYLLSAAGPAAAWADRSMLSVALLLDTVLLVGLARGFSSHPLADVATAASLATVLAAPLPWMTAPLLVAVAFLYSLGSAEGARRAAFRLFRRSLWWGSRALAAVAFVMASFDLAGGRPVSGLAAYAALALVLVAWSLIDETPWPAVLAAALGAADVTLAVDQGRLAGFGLQAGDYGPPWAALALLLGALAIGLGGWRRGAAGLLPVTATVLAAAALLKDVSHPPLEWWTLLFALALFGSAAVFQPRHRLPLLERSIDLLARSPALRTALHAGYTYLVAWLLPFWVWLTLDRLPMLALSREERGIGLVLLAWTYLGAGRLTKAAGYKAPWLVTLPLLAASGLLVAAGERASFIIADGAATLLCVALALALGTPRWLYPAAFLAAPAWLLGLAHLGLPTRLLGSGLLFLAVGELALAEWLTRRAEIEPDRIPAAALPFWIAGFVLIPGALLWASVGGATVALTTFLAGAAVYWTAGLRFRDALFSYPVTALLGLSYLVALPLLRDRLMIGAVPWAVWCLPGVAASMLAAVLLSRTHPPLQWRPFFSRSPAAAPLVLAGGGAAATAVLAWSEPWTRVWVTIAVGAVYLLGLAASPSRRWLYPALLAGHLAYAFAVLDAGLADTRPLTVWFVPLMLAMTAAGILASRGRDRGAGRRLADRFASADWGGPFYAFAGVGLAVWTVAAVGDAPTLTLVMTGGTLMVGAIAARWQDGRLAMLSALLAAAAILAAFAWRGVDTPDLEPWMALTALAFGALWGGARAGIGRPGGALSGAARLWAGPLRLEAIVLGAIALGGSIVAVLAGVPGADRAFVLCLALVGFLALEIATLEHREGLSYTAVLMLGTAWGLWFYYDRGVHDVQFYAVPGAVYLLWIGQAQDRARRRGLAGVIDGAGLTLLLGASLVQSVTQARSPLTLVYGSLAAAESLGVLWWGIARRRRRFIAAGTGGLVLGVGAQLVERLLPMGRWVITGVVGLVLVLGALVVERQRAAIVRVSQQVRARMEGWRW